MLLALALTLGVAILIGYHPLQLHLDSLRLAQPVVVFRGRFWQVPTLLWALFQAALGAVLLLAAGAIMVRLGLRWYAHWQALLIAVGLLLVAWWQFPGIRLLWTYWRHDGRASLVFNREEQAATYTNREFCLNFALASVVTLTGHCPRRSRAASADYSYTVLAFADNSELVITSLLCDYDSLRTLLPTTKTEVVMPRYAWLPTDQYSQHVFGFFFSTRSPYPSSPPHVRNPASRPAADAARNKRRRPL